MLCTVLLAATANTSLAADYFDVSNVLAGSGLSTDSPTDIALTLLATFLGLVGLIAVCMIVYGGVLILLSGGNPEKVKHGRDTLIWAIIGSIIIFSALGIVLYIDSVLFSD